MSKPQKPVDQGEAPRLQKVLAERGLGSRREIESWVRAGRVLVDGRVAELGQRLSGGERVEIDGKPILVETEAVRQRVLLYNKPSGQVTTRRDPERRATVFEHLPTLRHGRWIAVGRLDLNTQGLLLLTTDGELAHRLMHPSHEIEREYAVRILGEVGPGVVERLQAGVELDGEARAFDQVTPAGGSGANQWYHVILREGRNREVRRLWESQGVRVSRLIRVRYGPVTLPRDLPAGRGRNLDEATTRILLEMVGLRRQPAPERQAPPRKAPPRKAPPRQAPSGRRAAERSPAAARKRAPSRRRT